jgi:hypothetical protein
MIVESLGRQTDQISIIAVDEESFKTMFDIERCIETSDCTSSSLTSDEVIEMESKIYGPIISKEDDSDASMILEVNELINLCPSTPPPKRLRPHRMKKPKGGIAKLLYKKPTNNSRSRLSMGEFKALDVNVIAKNGVLTFTFSKKKG